MKRRFIVFMCFLMFFCVIFDNYQKIQLVFANNDLVEYNGEVEHLFTHCLLAYPKKAFTERMKYDYDRDCLTPFEFQNILKELYKKNYVLFNINSLFKSENGKVVKNRLFLPKGKKPLVFSFDDVVYDSKKAGVGMVDKIIVKNGELYTQTEIDGKVDIRNDNEFICIMENFIQKHPDFSFNGARGTICLTGFDGILGYRTYNKKNSESEKIKAKEVVQVLKDKGWNFACHSFGHYHMKKLSLKEFQEEVDLWNKETKHLIGETQIYVYPYGEWQLFDDDWQITRKHQILLDNGFKLFCGVGMKNFFSYMPFSNNKNTKFLFMDRKAVDGYTLKNRKEDFKNLFDTDKVYDFQNRSLLKKRV